MLPLTDDEILSFSHQMMDAFWAEYNADQATSRKVMVRDATPEEAARFKGEDHDGSASITPDDLHAGRTAACLESCRQLARNAKHLPFGWASRLTGDIYFGRGRFVRYGDWKPRLTCQFDKGAGRLVLTLLLAGIGVAPDPDCVPTKRPHYAVPGEYPLLGAQPAGG